MNILTNVLVISPVNAVNGILFDLVFGDANHQPQIEVASGRFPVSLDTFSRDAQTLAALGAARDLYFYRTYGRRDFYSRAANRFSHRDRQIHGHVTTGTLEQGMCPNPRDNIEIPWRSALQSGFAFCGYANALTGLSSRRDIDGYALRPQDPSAPAAVITGISGELAGP